MSALYDPCRSACPQAQALGWNALTTRPLVLAAAAEDMFAEDSEEA
ncbi:hypothetical protein OG897_01765 [Streptomyces sp. NBC_00237]|nr:hypothetical protein [Streptomyces sp. NBC_00237]MCX5200193.1 hypothetical protein [Streptomyces sp. NBC_00237]